jgi:hypothetical protein
MDEWISRRLRGGSEQRAQTHNEDETQEDFLNHFLQRTSRNSATAEN